MTLSQESHHYANGLEMFIRVWNLASGSLAYESVSQALPVADCPGGVVADVDRLSCHKRVENYVPDLVESKKTLYTCILSQYSYFPGVWSP